jgi:hypothetical protein
MIEALRNPYTRLGLVAAAAGIAVGACTVPGNRTPSEPSSTVHNACSAEPFVCKTTKTFRGEPVFTLNQQGTDYAIFSGQMSGSYKGVVETGDEFTMHCVGDHGASVDITLVTDTGDTTHLNRDFVPGAVSGFTGVGSIHEDYTWASNVASLATQ